VKERKTAETLGRIGLPAPILQLATKTWDVIVIGAGHNGLTCAAYLAKAGKRVLVLESRERVGGACTLEEPWPGVRVSPCAYVVGLLHNLVLSELGLKAHGFDWIPASAGMFVPFDDGSSIQLWNDDAQCEAEVKRFAPKDFAGWKAMGDVKRRLRDRLRPEGPNDLWVGEAPTEEVLMERLAGDEEARDLLLNWSMVELVDRYLSDERLKMAYLGQGVIGTNASPFDAGTASIHFHHASGRFDGQAGTWGYVKGGMGMVSFLLCDIARELGAVVAAGVPVAQIIPGEGVQLESGEKIFAPIVVSNADPRVVLRLLGDAVDSSWKKQVESVPIEGCTAKINLLLKELPNFKARPGTLPGPHHQGQINTPLTKLEWQESFQLMRAGKVSSRVWTELYFQSVFDRSIVPDGKHTMSVFAQYVPYRFAEGNWESKRKEVEKIILDSVGRFCTNLPDAILRSEILGPPDIEKKVGLTGGHIFQGECLPRYMWANRLQARTPMKGLYLCGAATHPGGSVIAINGRNAAVQILAEHT
jgi:phytoene dehydrogenase-like protein